MLTGVLLAAATAPISLTVNPKGSDQNEGSASRPLRTLSAGLAKSRESGAKLIVLSSGVHVLQDTLVLTPADKGLTIRGAGPGQTVVSGGVRLAGWTRSADGVLSAPAPSGLVPMMLTVNGRPRAKSRLPEAGFFEHESTFPVAWMSTTGGGWQRKPTADELTTMVVRAGDLPAGFSAANAEITVHHMWDESIAGVKSYDPAARKITFDSELGHPPGAFDVKRYVVWNLREGLTKPGLWMHDRQAGRVLYRPLPGEDPAKVEAWLTRLPQLFRLEQGADDITISGMALAHANTPLRRGGFGAGDCEGAITANKANRLALLDLLISNTAGHGAKTWECEGGRVINVVARDTGGVGLKVDGKGLLVEDCLVERPGRVFPSAIGLWTSGAGHIVRHNTVRDTPYTGILPGSDDCLVELNLIERAMQELHDGAAIYTGFNKGAIIRRNIVRDIKDTGGYGACAYYVDEQGVGARVEDNLSVGVGEPLRFHMAKDGLIAGNVFVHDGDMKLTFARSTNNRFERNVVASGGGIVFTGPPDAFAALRESVLSSATGKVERDVLNQYSSSKREALSAAGGLVFGQPGFAPGSHGFSPGSAGAKLGLKNEPWKGAGRRLR